MAGFCAKCGAPLTSATGFCASCGAPIVAVAAAPPPAGYPVGPAKSSGGALKIILIVVAVIVGLGILGLGSLAYVGWRVSKAVTTAGKGITVSSTGNGSTVTVPGVGTVTSGTSATVTAQDIGVPLYPGATQVPSGSSTIAKGSGRVVQATFWTSDPVSSVTAFYQGKLGSALSSMSLGSETIMNYGGGNNAVTIMVNTENGKTRLNVIHTVNQTQ